MHLASTPAGRSCPGHQIFRAVRAGEISRPWDRGSCVLALCVFPGMCVSSAAVGGLDSSTSEIRYRFKLVLHTVPDFTVQRHGGVASSAASVSGYAMTG
jgi:hypothetical protein